MTMYPKLSLVAYFVWVTRNAKNNTIKRPAASPIVSITHDHMDSASIYDAGVTSNKK